MDALTNNRRQRRIAARRAQILQAAAAVFSRLGYERATTREIAETADLSEGTLYNYFPSKRDLLSGVASNFADDVAGAIARIEAESLEDMMAQLLAARFRSGRERRLFMLFLYEARLSPDVHDYYVQQALARIIEETERLLRRLIADGIMRPVDPAVAARTISATIMGYAALYELGVGLQDEDSALRSPEVLGSEVTEIFLKGLQTRPRDGA